MAAIAAVSDAAAIPIPLRRAVDLPPTPDEQRAEQIRALLRQTPTLLIGNLLGIAALTAMFWPHTPSALVGGWAFAGAVLSLVRWLHYRRFARRRYAQAEVLLGWGRSWHAMVVLQGALWGVAAWVFMAAARPSRRSR